MKFDQKGIFGPFTIVTSVITGSIFPLLGSLLALDLQVIETPYYGGIFLVMFGGFIAQWLFAHTIHDLVHIKIEQRQTLSKQALKFYLVVAAIILLVIAVYLSYMRGWPVFVFALIGAVACLYAEGFLHHESQMAFGAMFLVIGGFYVQAATLDLAPIVWLKVVIMSLFAFFSQYGWLLFYRLDDYGWSKKVKNRSILVAKTGLLFLIVYFIL